MSNKDSAILDFLISCPAIINSPLYFNFAEAKAGTKQFVTMANDVAVNRPYVDGSVLRRYTFTIIDFRNVVYNPIAKDTDYTQSDANLENYLDVQALIDWVMIQADNLNFPDFGEDCTVDSMRVTATNPNLNGIDSSKTPAVAKYSVSIIVDYVDKSKMIWR